MPRRFRIVYWSLMAVLAVAVLTTFVVPALGGD
jgi:hypothetical protein